MWAIIRFRVPERDALVFRVRADEVVAFFGSRAGNVGAELVQNLDDPELWAIVTRWADVGSYRRSFNGYDAKMLLTPLLSRAIDEPSAYLPPEDLGANRPRGG